MNRLQTCRTAGKTVASPSMARRYHPEPPSPSRDVIRECRLASPSPGVAFVKLLFYNIGGWIPGSESGQGSVGRTVERCLERGTGDGPRRGSSLWMSPAFRDR